MSALSEVLADSPTSFWRLNDVAGSFTAPDLGSANNELDYSGGASATFQVPGPILSEGASSYGVRFPAGTNYVSLYEPTYTKVYYNGSFSAAVWFRTTTTLAAVNRIFGLGILPPTSTSFSYLFWLGTNGTVRASMQNSYGIIQTITSTIVATDGNWRRFVMTYDAALASFKFYVNKTLIGSSDLPSDYYGAGVSAYDYFRIGSHDTTNRITADYADAALWLGATLSAARVAAQYDAAIGAVVQPGSGAIIIGGGSPGIDQPRILYPGAGALSIIGDAPSILSETIIQPGSGALSIGGDAPGVLQPRVISPGAGALSIEPGPVGLYNPVTSGDGLAYFRTVTVLSRYGNSSFWMPSTQVLDESLIGLVAAANALSTAAGDLTLAMSGELSGNAGVQTTATGDLYSPEISGAAQVLSTAAGQLSSLIAIATTAQNTAGAAGNLDVIADIAGAAQVLTSASAAFQQVMALAASGGSTSTAAGSLGVGSGLSGSAALSSAASGTIGAQSPMEGTATGEASASASLGQSVGMEGSASGHVSADGGIGQEVALGGSAAAQVSAAGRLAVDVPKDGGITYAVNVATGAATTLSNFAFDRLITAHNRMYGIVNGTLYIVGGDTDPGDAAINATIRFAPSHYGAIGRKRLETLYCYSRELTGLLVTPIYDETSSIEYITTPLNRDGMRATRAFVGRGNSWHTLGFQVKNQGGGKLDIGGLEPIISPLSRKRR